VHVWGRHPYLDGELEVSGAYLASFFICSGVGIGSALLGAP
jgi:hypothetical protein